MSKLRKSVRGIPCHVRLEGICCGDPEKLIGNSVDRTILERFEEKFCPEPNTGCWLWVGDTGSAGYGRFYFNGERVLAHRAAYQIFVGPLPKDKVVMHKCDTPLCVNPEHLQMGTQAENLKDMAAKRRSTYGHKNAMAKLSHADAAKIKSDPRPQKEIAEKYGVAISAVSRIKSGKRWGHLHV